MQSPKYDLDMVKTTVSSWLKGNYESGWFSAPSCSIDYVIHIFNCTNSTAEKIVLEGLMKLETKNYYQRKSMWGDIVDEYGLSNYLGHNWYVKFMVGEDKVLEEISFHPCEKDMVLANGKVLFTTIDDHMIPAWRKN